MALYWYVTSVSLQDFFITINFVCCRLCPVSGPLNLKQSEQSGLCVWKVAAVTRYTEFYWNPELRPVTPVPSHTCNVKLALCSFFSPFPLSLFKKGLWRITSEVSYTLFLPCQFTITFYCRNKTISFQILMLWLMKISLSPPLCPQCIVFRGVN